MTFVLIYLLKLSCFQWPKGFKNEEINNDPLLYSCQFRYPDVCRIDMFSSIMDYTKLRKVDCLKNYPNADIVKDTWINHIKKKNNETLYDFKALIYPETNNNNFIFNKYDSFQAFYKSITKNIIFTNDTEELEEETPEIMLLKNKEKYEIKINLKFNQELSEKQAKKTSEEGTPKKNILFLYIDSLSRPHFFRKMNYLSQFLSKFNSNKASYYELFQFMKYQSFKNDFYNNGIQTIFYEKMPKRKHSELTYSHILTLFKKKGYITAQSANYCFKEFYPIQKEYNYFQKTLLDEYDHENIAMFCDPFFMKEMDNPSIKKCLYGKNSFEYVLDYGYQFWTKYPKNNKFLRLSFFEGNEKTGEVIKYLDYYLYQFLENLYQKKYLKNSIIFIVSGQGNSYNDLFNSLFYRDYDFFIEKYLGSFFMLIDKKRLKLNETDLINIRNNQQNMVTAYDIRETLKNIVNNKIYKDVKEVNDDNRNNDEILGKSLFGYIYSLERNCKKYPQITRDICRCYNY